MHECTCETHTEVPTPIGTALGNGVVAQWAPLSGADAGLRVEPIERPLKQCACGCNVYSGTSPVGPTDLDTLDIPVLPITLEYVDDDDASDDHEYVSVHVAELAQMVNQLRSCTCAQSST